jgi:hypothetical protein
MQLDQARELTQKVDVSPVSGKAELCGGHVSLNLSRRDPNSDQSPNLPTASLAHISTCNPHKLDFMVVAILILPILWKMILRHRVVTQLAQDHSLIMIRA